MARPKGKGKAATAKASGSGKKATSSSSTAANGKSKRAAGKATNIVKDVYSDDDEEDDEQEARMNAKMDIDGVYEYEQPETFENDSEIDEDEAFNSDDEQSYGNFFQANKAKSQGKKKKSSAGADDSDDDTAEFDDDDAEDDDDEEAGGDLLSDLLGTAPAKRLSTKHDNDNDDDEDSALENSDDDEPKNLSSLADGLVPERKKKKLLEISTDGVGLSASIAGGDGSGGGELTLSSLLGGGGDADTSAANGDDDGLNLSKVKKQVRDLETDGSAALQAAVAPVHEERATRKIAYVEKKKDVDLFQTVVRRNRQKETMDFREQTPKMENLTAASLTSKFSAQTSMEKDVEALLKAGDLSDRTVAKDEQDELAQKKVSKEEVVARQQELSKMRALMFYEEQKQKRIKKIKSKLYHKIRNGQDKKQAEKQQKQLRELDPELADQLENEMAEKRAEERMTLKHTNTSKWVKHQLKRGIQADNETRGAIAEQLRRGEELRRKVHTAASDDEDDDSGDDEDADDEGVDAVTRLQKRLERQAGALVMEIDEDEASASQTKGLHGMKFMQRAVQKQREKARTETEKLLRELKGEDGLLSDGDELSSGDEGKDVQDDNVAENNKTKKANKKKNAATAEDKQAVDKVLPKGALQTGNVSMDKGLSARASGAIAVDLGDGTTSKALGLTSGGAAGGKTIELGGNAKKANAKNAKAAPAPAVAEERNETEENPWLTGAATSTKNKKRNKKAATKIEQSGVDVANAIESLSKSVSKDAASAASDNSLALLTGKATATASKKRKLDQTTASAQPSSSEATVTPGNKKKAKQTATKTADGKLTQEELVRRAFAFADEDEDEIAREKDQIASQDTTAKKGAEIAKLVGMTGWGSWAGDGVKVSFRQQARETQAKKLAEDTKKQVLASRKDSKMDRVLINEKKDKRAAKFAVQDVPYPFTSREEYEMAMRNPLGSDWNTPASTNALTVPKIMKRAGVMINPLALTKADKKEAKKELSKQRKAKF